MERVWVEIPRSERVVKDVNIIFHVSILAIILNRVTIAPGLGNRRGRCDIKTKKISINWSGKRAKKEVNVLIHGSTLMRKFQVIILSREILRLKRNRMIRKKST